MQSCKSLYSQFARDDNFDKIFGAVKALQPFQIVFKWLRDITRAEKGSLLDRRSFTKSHPEGGSTTSSPIDCVDVGFGDQFFGMSHIRLSMRPALAMAGLHGFSAATGLRTST